LPAQFRLYFVLASDQLTPESETAYRAVFEDLKRRAAYEVEVVGHTDTVGVKANNHTLSLQRANAVRDRLVRDGLKGESIATAGRGEVDLAVPTADNVAEPRNRRVEITIR
jgi:outer membrane protein OmpA-like peptidoglycan-associated protein